MTTFWKWMAVFGAATAVDLVVRFGMPFQLTRILWAEAVLFPVAALAFLFLYREKPGETGFRRRFQIVMIVAFLLAGLRSGLWAFGLPIGTVNIAVLVATFLVWAGFRIRRRHLDRQAPSHS